MVGMNPKSIGNEAEADAQPANENEETAEQPAEKTSEDETRLLYQEYLLNPDQKIQEWLDER